MQYNTIELQIILRSITSAHSLEAIRENNTQETCIIRIKRMVRPDITPFH